MRSGGINIVMDWPIASAAAYPNSCSAARFQEVMIPVRSLLIIASSDDSMIAASRNAESGAGSRIGPIVLIPFTHERERTRTHSTQPLSFNYGGKRLY